MIDINILSYLNAQKWARVRSDRCSRLQDKKEAAMTVLNGHVVVSCKPPIPTCLNPFICKMIFIFIKFGFIILSTKWLEAVNEAQLHLHNKCLHQLFAFPRVMTFLHRHQGIFISHFYRKKRTTFLFSLSGLSLCWCWLPTDRTEKSCDASSVSSNLIIIFHPYSNPLFVSLCLS